MGFKKEDVVLWRDEREKPKTKEHGRHKSKVWMPDCKDKGGKQSIMECCIIKKFKIINIAYGISRCRYALVIG